MQKLRLFLDTHDREKQTFPASLTADQFAVFFADYERACQEEGVVVVRLHLGLDAGRAFCLNLAPDADAVRRAHEKVGLPFDSITEVSTASTGDLFFQRPAA